MTRFTQELAVEGFDGADVADITGRTPDGGGDLAKAIGLWVQAFTGSGQVGILGNVGVNTIGTDYAGYTLGSIPALPSTHGARLRQTLPSSDSATPPTGQYVEPWTYYAEGLGPDIPHGPWTGNVSDLVGGATIGGVIQINGLTLHPNGQPATIDIESIVTGAANAVQLSFRSFASALEGSTPHIVRLDLDWVNTVHPTVENPSPGFYFTPSTSVELFVGGAPSATVTRTNTIPDSPPDGSGSWQQESGSDHINQQVGTSSTHASVVIRMAQQADSGRFEWTLGEIATDDGTFELVDPGDGGDEFVNFGTSVCANADYSRAYATEATFSHPLGSDPSLAVDLYCYHESLGGSRKLAATYGPIFWPHDRAPDIQLDIVEEAGVHVLYAYLGDGATDDQMFRFAIGVDTPFTGVAADIPDLYGTGDPGFAGLDFNYVFFDLPLSWQLDEFAVCVPATDFPTVTIACGDNSLGAIRLSLTASDPTWGIAIERAEDGAGTGALPLTPPGGLDGTTTVLDDFMAPGTTWYYRAQAVLGEDAGAWSAWVGCIAAEFPCEGPPDNEYPHNPPQVDPRPSTRLWVMRGGSWNPVTTPGAANQAPGLVAYRGGAVRQPNALSVMRNGQYRLVEPLDTDQFPPTGPFPPFFDPCGDLPELPPGDVTPVPLTDRVFGVSQAPVSVCGPIFTGTKLPLGGWTPGDVTAAIAKSLVGVMTAQGTYNLYLLGGVWNLAYYLDVAHAKFGPFYSFLLPLVGAGYLGHSLFDDFNSALLWPTSGIPFADMVTVVADMQATYPGIPFGVRGRTREFPSNAGFSFYNSQYVSWRGESAYDFAFAEYTRALGWGAQIYLDPNYLHGGDGSSGEQWVNGTMLSGHYMMSATEVVAYLTDFYQAVLDVDATAGNLLGSLGYQYEPTQLALPGMTDALTTGRNLLAGLPAL